MSIEAREAIVVGIDNGARIFTAAMQYVGAVLAAWATRYLAAAA